MIAVPMPTQQQPNGTPGKKLPAPSVKLRLGRRPRQQRIDGATPARPVRRPVTMKESGEAMTLILRMQKAQDRIQGREPFERGEDDYAVIDETRIGRIQQLQAAPKWRWSLEVAPAPPNQGIADTLDEAKVAFAKRYEKVKRGQALVDKAPAHWRPNWLSKSLSRRLTEQRFLELLDWWAEEGDPEEIAAYLAHRMTYNSKWMRIVELVPVALAKAEAQAIEHEQRHGE
jgi:hypothetical protein